MSTTLALRPDSSFTTGSSPNRATSGPLALNPDSGPTTGDVIASALVPTFRPERREGEPPLNHRQEKFCAHYALSGNAAEAARYAGYSDRSAKNQGFRLLRDRRVNDHVYRLRVERAIKFGPVMAFTRLESLFFKASAAGDFRGAAHILTLQARLSGVEHWLPPSTVVKEKQLEELGLGRAGHSRRVSNDKPRLGRGVFGPKGRDPFNNLDEQCNIAYAPPAGEETDNDDQR